MQEYSSKTREMTVVRVCHTCPGLCLCPPFCPCSLCPPSNAPLSTKPDAYTGRDRLSAKVSSQLGLGSRAKLSLQLKSVSHSSPVLVLSLPAGRPLPAPAPGPPPPSAPLAAPRPGPRPRPSPVSPATPTLSRAAPLLTAVGNKNSK